MCVRYVTYKWYKRSTLHDVRYVTYMIHTCHTCIIRFHRYMTYKVTWHIQSARRGLSKNVAMSMARVASPCRPLNGFLAEQWPCRKEVAVHEVAVVSVSLFHMHETFCSNRHFVTLDGSLLKRLVMFTSCNVFIWCTVTVTFGHSYL
jgi:hypothetical protein